MKYAGRRRTICTYYLTYLYFMLSKQQLIAGAAGAVLTLGLGAGAITFAATGTTPTSAVAAITSGMRKQPGVGGTVTAVNGNTVTVTGADGKTYTIDASAATVTKDETVSVSNIAVGDTVMANGTVNGTSVTATAIHDGKMSGGFGGRGMWGPGGMGRGVHGTVSAINGSTLTVTSTNPQTNVASTYTVDASNATVLKGDGTTKPSTSSLSAVAVGDNVMIMGATSGTNVTAKMIVDGPMPKMGSWGSQKPTTTTTTTQ
jgi:hypothetical protein